MARRNPRAPRAPKPQPVVEQPAEEIVEQQDTSTPTEEAKPTRPVGTSNLATTIRSHRHRYVPALAPSGKKTANNGDSVARILLATPLSDLAAFVMARFGKRYDHLNTGHERMCCGNLVRAEFKKGDEQTLAWLAARDPLNATPADEAEEA